MDLEPDALPRSTDHERQMVMQLLCQIEAGEIGPHHL